MFRVRSNQQYQHLTNQKLRLWANAVFQNRGVCLPAKSRRTSGRRFSPSLFRRDRSDDRIYVCCSQARSLRASVSFFPLPLPHHSFFFVLVPTFLDELARKHLEASGERSDHGLWSFSQADDSKKGNGKWKHGAISM